MPLHLLYSACSSSSSNSPFSSSSSSLSSPSASRTATSITPNNMACASPQQPSIPSKQFGRPPALPSSSHESWEAFFKRNSSNFFKDRHWFQDEHPAIFTRLKTLPTNILDLGCGCGNTALPLLENSPLISYLGVDGSLEAIELLRKDCRFDAKRCQGLVADISHPVDFNPPPQRFDLVLMIFVLSALTPEEMERAVDRASNSLRPGGLLVFRDYAQGDLAQLRFRVAARQSRNAYTRSDGTLSFFFSQAGLMRLFGDRGFSCLCCNRLLRLVVNRKTAVEMPRYFYSCEFVKL